MADLPTLPPADCIRQVLTAAQMRITDQWDAHGFFAYQGTANERNIHAVLQVHRKPDGRYRYSNGLVYYGGTKSRAQPDVDAVRPMLRTIDAALMDQCGLTEPVKEVCYDVDCKPL